MLTPILANVLLLFAVVVLSIGAVLWTVVRIEGGLVWPARRNRPRAAALSDSRGVQPNEEQ